MNISFDFNRISFSSHHSDSINRLIANFVDVPIVGLELGSKLQLDAIKEGDDVYMECNIRANPWVTKVAWKHNVRI